MENIMKDITDRLTKKMMSDPEMALCVTEGVPLKIQSFKVGEELKIRVSTEIPVAIEDGVIKVFEDGTWHRFQRPPLPQSGD